MSRAIHRMYIQDEIMRVKEALKSVDPSDRMHVLAEVLWDLNDNNVEKVSCGCYDWDITMDYRPHPERYSEKDK